MNRLSIVTMVLALSACDQSTKPYYILDDSPIYQYQGGDQLTYNVLNISPSNNGDELGVYSLTFNETNQPRLLEIYQTLQENFSEDVNFKPPFFSRHLLYNNDGDRELVAVSWGNEVFWLTEEQTLSTIISYFAHTANTPKEYVAKRELEICNEKSCEKSGEIVVRYNYEGEELSITPYADFDTYKISINIEINITQNSISDTNKQYNLSGKEWVYPPLGVVKYEYDIATNNSTQTTLLGHLSQTNISIPEALKQSE